MDASQPDPRAKRERTQNSKLDDYATGAVTKPRNQISDDVKLGRPSGVGDQQTRKKRGQSRVGRTQESLEARHASVEPDPVPEEKGDDADEDFCMHQP